MCVTCPWNGSVDVLTVLESGTDSSQGGSSERLPGRVRHAGPSGRKYGRLLPQILGHPKALCEELALDEETSINALPNG